MIFRSRKLPPQAFADQEILIGQGIVKSILPDSVGYPGLIIASPTAYKVSEVKAAVDALVHKGWDLALTSSGEPRSLSVVEFLENYPAQPAEIVVFGGGSTIDFAKAVSAAYVVPEALNSLEVRRSFRLDAGLGINPITCIPTTLGSGSESSSSALLVNGGGKKVALFGPALIPKTVLLDAELILSNSESVLAASVLDAIGHAFEGYFSTIKNPMFDALGPFVIRSLVSSPITDARGNLDGLEKTQLMANLAGQIQDKCLVGPAHVLAHHFNTISHGLAVGIFLRKLIGVYSTSADPLIRAKRDSFFSELGLTESELLDSVSSLIEVAMNGNELPEFRWSPDDVKAMKLDPAALASPVEISPTLIEEMTSL